MHLSISDFMENWYEFSDWFIVLLPYNIFGSFGRSFFSRSWNIFDRKGILDLKTSVKKDKISLGIVGGGINGFNKK